jgi:hypothetical protein
MWIAKTTRPSDNRRAVSGVEVLDEILSLLLKEQAREEPEKGSRSRNPCEFEIELESLAPSHDSRANF